MVFLLDLENGKWVTIRECYIHDRKQMQDAQVHLCESDMCNTASSYGPVSLITTLAAPMLFILSSKILK